MKKTRRSTRYYLALAASLSLSLSLAHADTPDVTLLNGQTETVNSGQSISYNNTADNTAISIKGTSTSAANKITINNSGTITTAPGSTSGRAIRDNSGTSNSVINNNSGGLITSSGDDTISVTAASGTTTASIVDVENHGTIQSLDGNGSGTTTPGAAGDQAINIAATSGNSVVHNYNTGVIWATAADAVRPGTNGVVDNDGFIYSNAFYTGSGATLSGTGSDGIDVEGKSVSGQNFNLVVSGVTIVNGYTTTTPGGTVAQYGSNLTDPETNFVGVNSAGVALTDSTIEGGRHGITGGNTGVSGGAVQYGGYLGTGSYSMTITNNQGALIEGEDGSGINIDGFGIQNGTKFTTNENVTVTNYGTITGSGQSRDGDGIDVDGDVIINNQGSVISKNASPEAGDPAGSIEFSEGITVGGGIITNGSATNSTATVEGEVAAGNTQAVGRGITLAGIDHDTNDVSLPIESIYENSTITNSGLIKGDSESGIAVLGTTGGGYSVTITNNATGNIVGNNTGVSEASSVTYNSVTSSNGQSLNQGAIELDDKGDTYEVDNYGTITQGGASGVAVAMHSTTSNVLNVYGGAINGDVAGDTAGDSNLTFDVGASSTGSFSFSHNISNFAVNVKSGFVQFSGTIGNTGATTVSGGKLDITGSMLDSATTVQSAGQLLGDGAAGTVAVKSGGVAQAGDSATVLASTQAASTNAKFSLTGLTVDGGSTLAFNLDHATAGTGTTTNPAGGTMFDLGLSGLFAAGANVAPGSVLLNFDGSTVGGTVAAPNVYELVAFAPAGTTLTTSDFTVQNLLVDGGGAYGLSFVGLSDGQEALDLTVAPEPGTWTMLIGGLGLLAAFRRWRKLSI